MTNAQLITCWKRLGIKFNTTKEVRPLTEMFAVCWGESETEIDGKKQKVVVFDEGGEQGSPALFCKTDNKDTCWVCCWDGKKKTGVTANVGKFVKIEEINDESRNKQKPIRSSKF